MRVCVHAPSPCSIRLAIVDTVSVSSNEVDEDEEVRIDGRDEERIARFFGGGRVFVTPGQA